MALSAAFSIARIIIGVASTGGSNASLNRFAKCSGATTRLKLPFAPTGISDMPDLLMPRLTPARTIHRSGGLDGGLTAPESLAFDVRRCLADGTNRRHRAVDAVRLVRAGPKSEEHRQSSSCPVLVHRCA